MNRILIWVLLVCLLATACEAEATPAPTIPPVQFFPEPIHTPLPNATAIAPPTRAPKRDATTIPLMAPTSTPKTTFQTPAFNTVAWKDLPVIPESIDPSLSKVYERGVRLGNDPHAFSIFGDCQTQPDEFFGVFESDRLVFASLPGELQETVTYFEGSFSRQSSTSQDGTTPGALLWTQWHRGQYGCTFGETPVECELRVHRPSFVIIQIGTHFESRNTEYLRKIILQLLDEGVVPILATKADNREKDERINRDMASLASEYDLPLWNFWAALSDLPGRGLYTRDDRPLQGPIYLNEEAALRHRMTGLAALNAVWRAVAGE
ncbi:MAG TPA: SGNH/GDSL hydrolase family protein [Anaerolineales bacterium]